MPEVVNTVEKPLESAMTADAEVAARRRTVPGMTSSELVGVEKADLRWGEERSKRVYM